MKQLKIIIIMVALLGVAACRSSKEPAATIDYSSSSLEQRFDSLAARSLDWSRVNLPVSLDLRQPASLSASGRAYMRRGEDIYISMRFLGMEVATIYLNNDSIFGSDKINKRYIAEPISSVLADASITLSDIQDILIGRAFINAQGTVLPSSIKDVKLSAADDFWTITPKKRMAGADYSFDISNESNNLQAFNILRQGKRITCNYSDPAETIHGLFMSTANVRTEISGKKLDVSIKWSWQSAKWSVDESVRWRMPKGYKRVDPMMFLKQ